MTALNPMFIKVCGFMGTVGFIRGLYKCKKTDSKDTVLLATMNGLYYANPVLIPYSIYSIIDNNKEYYEVFGK